MYIKKTVVILFFGLALVATGCKPKGEKKETTETDKPNIIFILADILNVEYPDNVSEDSYSYLSALKLPSNSAKRKSIVHHSINGSFAYRKDDWKVCFCPGSGGWSDPKPNSKGIELLPIVQLYNLNNDIAKEHNLQAEHLEIVENFRKELSVIVNNGRSTQGENQSNDGPETWPQLNWMNK